MRFFLGMVLIALLSAVGEYYLPWWVIAVVCFAVSLIVGLRPGRSFLMGFLGIAIFWADAALLHDVANQHILSTRMAALFHLPSSTMFICVTVLVGSLVGGLAAWAGALLRGNVSKPDSA